jgi:hypothetical protein
LKALELGANDVDDIARFLSVNELMNSEDSSKTIQEQLNNMKEKKSYLFGNEKKSVTNENNIVFTGGEKTPREKFLGF